MSIFSGEEKQQRHGKVTYKEERFQNFAKRRLVVLVENGRACVGRGATRCFILSRAICVRVILGGHIRMVRRLLRAGLIRTLWGRMRSFSIPPTDHSASNISTEKARRASVVGPRHRSHQNAGMDGEGCELMPKKPIEGRLRFISSLYDNPFGDGKHHEPTCGR